MPYGRRNTGKEVQEAPTEIQKKELHRHYPTIDPLMKFENSTAKLIEAGTGFILPKTDPKKARSYEEFVATNKDMERVWKIELRSASRKLISLSLRQSP